MKSRFRFWSYLMLACFLAMTYILLLLIYVVFFKQANEKDTIIVVVIFFFLFVWLWLFFGEIRTKTISAHLSNEGIRYKTYFGFSFSQIYKWSDFEGYKTSLVPSKGRSYEYLYLFINGKKVIKVSEFYHSNYSEMKKYVAARVSYLGKEDYRYFRDIKEVFEF
ncbi:hypothetical protein PDL71_10010 [Lacibacter sp. MH-610]|uniref:hypothetical protein n=1 Tax=Lacibacter sp. MH-610 TaxID=3020883 RepID=UPI0038914F67